MHLGQEFAKELSLEAAVTRRFLAQVPFDQLDFKPAEKSEPLGRLAIHLAEIVAWWSSVVHDDTLDFIDFKPKTIATREELLSYFDTLLAKALTDLSQVTDATFDNPWSMTHGNEILFTLPKRQVARLFCMNHFIHHRAQLGMYLRLMNISVPATYGPSADDEDVILINPFS